MILHRLRCIANCPSQIILIDNKQHFYPLCANPLSASMRAFFKQQCVWYGYSFVSCLRFVPPTAFLCCITFEKKLDHLWIRQGFRKRRNLSDLRKWFHSPKSCSLLYWYFLHYRLFRVLICKNLFCAPVFLISLSRERHLKLQSYHPL